MIGTRSILSLLLAVGLAMPLCCCQAMANDPDVYVGTGKASSVSSKGNPSATGHGCCTKTKKASKSCPKKAKTSGGCCCGSACQASVIDAKSNSTIHAALVIGQIFTPVATLNFDFAPTIPAAHRTMESPPAPRLLSTRLAVLCVYRC